jgi:hypothetical protein
MSFLPKWCGMDFIKWTGNASMETKNDAHCWMVIIRVGLLGQSFRVGFYCILQQFGNQKFWVVGENG